MNKPEPKIIPEKLLELLATQTTQKITPAINTLVDAARNNHGDSVRAVLFYGSCLRSGDVDDGLADLYLLVDDYHAAFDGRTLAFFNQLLPPNVFYLEVPFQGRTLRAKYAVLTLADFRNGTENWFHSYLWGRFSQKCGLIYSHNKQTTTEVMESLAGAVTTFISHALPQMESPFTARDLWARGLSLSYRSELRTEQADGAARLFDSDPDYYQQLTQIALENPCFSVTTDTDTTPCCYQITTSEKNRRLNRISWRVRAFQGKLLSVLRLAKGLFTFKGGIDYILWKIERHSGVRIEVSPALKRIPLLAVPVIFWRLFRRGAFR
jgi:hypothetical protein